MAKLTEDQIKSIYVNDFDHYAELANRTLSLKFSDNNISDVTLHCIMGLCTDASELIKGYHIDPSNNTYSDNAGY